MPSESQIEVYRQHQSAQDKNIYFLLAAVGAAIGFALNQTQAARLALTQIPLGLALVCWATSFFCGCRHLMYRECILDSNHEMLRVQSGEHPEIGRHMGMANAACEGIRQAIEANQCRAKRFADWQFRLFMLGGICYIGWHILEMWLRAIAAS